MYNAYGERVYRKRKRSHPVIWSFLILALIIGLGYFIYSELKPRLVKNVYLEAGNSTLDVRSFLLYEEDKGRLITDISTIDFNTPGVYEIAIRVRSRIQISKLTIIDRTPPTAETMDVIALMGEELSESRFIKSVTDATPVSLKFISKPDTSLPGEQTVDILLEDSSQNITKVTANLRVLNVKSSVQVEAGEPIRITSRDYVNFDWEAEKLFIRTDLTKLSTERPGIYEIQLEMEGKMLSSYLEVVDTTPPQARTIAQTTWQNESINAESFVRDISDRSGVEMFYSKEPDWSLAGSQLVGIHLVDTYGNAAELTATLTILEDKEPPVFRGVQDKTVHIGEGIAYRKGVTVEDNRDKNLSFQVDSSKVDLSKEGEYPVYYSAVDSSGNRTEKKATVRVIVFTVDEDEMNEMLDQILGRISDSSMTKREVAHAIYKYIKGHVAYVGDSDKSDTLAEAYRGIKNAKGDCFTYYAVAEALLTRAGIDNMRVTRVGGKTQHFWNLINCGDGWYHFDSCPNKDKVETFMLTDSELEEFSKTRGSYYYNYDKSLYPETPK